MIDLVSLLTKVQLHMERRDFGSCLAFGLGIGNGKSCQTSNFFSNAWSECRTITKVVSQGTMSHLTMQSLPWLEHPLNSHGDFFKASFRINTDCLNNASRCIQSACANAIANCMHFSFQVWVLLNQFWCHFQNFWSVFALSLSQRIATSHAFLLILQRDTKGNRIKHASTSQNGSHF